MPDAWKPTEISQDVYYEVKDRHDLDDIKQAVQ
jgi:hypothetical protein